MIRSTPIFALEESSKVYIYIHQWVEHRRDKPWAWVRILASIIFLILPLHSFFLCYPGEELEGPISIGLCKKLNNVDSNNDIQIYKNCNTIYIYICKQICTNDAIS